MAGNLVKSVMLKITASDGDTEAKLDKITEKADELARKHPELKVRIDTGAASAKLAVLRRELRDTAKDAEDSKIRFGAFGAAVNDLTAGLPSGIGEMSTFQKVIAGLNLATGLAEPLVAGMVVAVGGLSAGLVSAGAGLGVFGVTAKAVWSSVSKQVTAVAAAQEKIAAGATGKNLIADNQAIAASLKGLNAGQQSLVLGASNAELSWHKFTLGAAAGVSSVLVPALGLVPRALSLMKGFLGPVEAGLRTVVAEVGKGLNSEGFTSFIRMLQANAGPMIGKLATAIGHVVVGIGGILRAFMPVAQQMGSGLDSITAKFAKWGSTLSSHSGFQSLMSMFKTETPMAVHALSQIGSLIKTVVSNMSGLSTFSNSKMLLQALTPVLGLLNKMAKVPGLVSLVLYLKLATDGGRKLSTAFKGIQAGLGVFKAGSSALQDFSAGFSNSAAAASSATGAFGTFGGKIASMGSSIGSFVSGYTAKLGTAMAATGTWIAEHAVAAGSFIAENVTMAASATAAFIAENAATLGLVAGIGALVAGIVYVATHWKQTWSAIKTVAADTWHFIDSKLIHPLMAGVGAVVDFVKAHWKILATVIGTMLLGPIAGLAIYVATHWQQIRDLTSRLVGDVTRFFGQLPGKILGVLSPLASGLFSLGKNIVMGLIHGIESAGGALISAAKNLAGQVLGPFKGVLGLFSPSRVMIGHGQNTVRGLIIGMDSMHGPLEAASARMAAAVSGAVTTGGAMRTAGGGGTPIVIEMSIPHGAAAMLPAEFWTQFKNGIRVRGGDPRIVTAKVKFA